MYSISQDTTHSLLKDSTPGTGVRQISRHEVPDSEGHVARAGFVRYDQRNLSMRIDPLLHLIARPTRGRPVFDLGDECSRRQMRGRRRTSRDNSGYAQAPLIGKDTKPNTPFGSRLDRRRVRTTKPHSVFRLVKDDTGMFQRAESETS